MVCKCCFNNSVKFQILKKMHFIPSITIDLISKIASALMHTLHTWYGLANESHSIDIVAQIPVKIKRILMSYYGIALYCDFIFAFCEVYQSWIGGMSETSPIVWLKEMDSVNIQCFQSQFAWDIIRIRMSHLIILSSGTYRMANENGKN